MLSLEIYQIYLGFNDLTFYIDFNLIGLHVHSVSTVASVPFLSSSFLSNLIPNVILVLLQCSLMNRSCLVTK